MKSIAIWPLAAIILTSSLILTGCSLKSDSSDNSNNIGFSNDDQLTEQITPYVDQFANTKIELTQTLKMNQEFKIKYLTADPKGVGEADFKAKSFKPLAGVGADVKPEDGKQLYVLEIAVHGNKNNKGSPSTFNQIGDTPSPQFVLIDRNNNQTYVEETYYSDAYTLDKKYFELSKITLDHEQWVNTAIVFQVNKDLNPELAFRFIDPDGKVQFYAIK